MMTRNRNKRSILSLGLILMMAVIFTMAIMPSEVIADGNGDAIGVPPNAPGDSIPADTTGGTSSSSNNNTLDNDLATVTIDLVLTINEILN